MISIELWFLFFFPVIIIAVCFCGWTDNPVDDGECAVSISIHFFSNRIKIQWTCEEINDLNHLSLQLRWWTITEHEWNVKTPADPFWLWQRKSATILLQSKLVQQQLEFQQRSEEKQGIRLLVFDFGFVPAAETSSLQFRRNPTQFISKFYIEN